MKKRFVLLGLMCVLAVISVSGCVVSPAGGGAETISYVMGNLETVEQARFSNVYDAARTALDDLNMVVTKEIKEPVYAKIIARDSADKKVTIILEATPQQTTEISIRAGVIGNESRSMQIYEEIRKNI